MPIRLHAEDAALLREAIRYTAAETGFSARLIEKDYFCSVVLEHLAGECGGLTFKGGTCLSKVHGGFYRLSEDLDFSISTAVDSARGERRRSVQPLRQALAHVEERLPGFRVAEALRGFNNSTQYNAVLSHESLIDGHIELVSIEVGVREPNMTEPVQGTARTVLLNPIGGQALVDTYPVVALSYLEAMAEKVRAALCRSEVAIRDFFDVDHAVRISGFDPAQAGFVDLVRRKLAIPRTPEPDLSDRRIGQVERQLEAQLRPVLREQEFRQFDLARAVGTLRRIKLALTPGEH
jgi:predicted nucleotidyltransferase component of viral defense system